MDTIASGTLKLPSVKVAPTLTTSSPSELVEVDSALIAHYRETLLGKREKERTVKSKYSPVPLPGTLTDVIFVAIIM